MNKYNEKDIKYMISKAAGVDKIPKRLRIIYNTTEFFNIDYDDVLILQDRPFFIRNCCKEGRFGIGEQDKYWVRRAIDLESGDLKIIKMVYHENFNIRVGNLNIDFVRSPRKEGRILNKVKGHPNFMQGITLTDDAGNLIRIVDFIKGCSWHGLIPQLGKSHEDYYINYLPKILSEFHQLIKAIGFLHRHGELHGDIRVDHILKSQGDSQMSQGDSHVPQDDSYIPQCDSQITIESGVNKWIDFDYSYMMHGESHFGFDLFGILDILLYLVGRGYVTFQSLTTLLNDIEFGSRPATFGSRPATLNESDMNILVKGRIVNLRKIYPYISERLNKILLYISIGHDDFYDSTEQITHDLKEALIDMQ